jgi:hypothetical protein
MPGDVLVFLVSERKAKLSETGAILPRGSLELGWTFVGDNPMDMGSRRLLSWCVSLEISANFREELPGPRIRW